MHRFKESKVCHSVHLGVVVHRSARIFGGFYAQCPHGCMKEFAAAGLIDICSGMNKHAHTYIHIHILTSICIYIYIHIYTRLDLIAWPALYDEKDVEEYKDSTPTRVAYVASGIASSGVGGGT